MFRCWPVPFFNRRRLVLGLIRKQLTARTSGLADGIELRMGGLRELGIAAGRRFVGRDIDAAVVGIVVQWIDAALDERK